MKKIFAILLALVMILSLTACKEPDNKKASSGESNSSKSYSDTTAQMTDSEIERIVVQKLLEKLQTTRGSNLDLDPGSCRYSINKIERMGSNIYVYGTVTFYDKYGELTKVSGDYSKSFTVMLNNQTGGGYCSLD